MKVVLIAPPIMDTLGLELRVIAQDATFNCPPYGIYLLAGILRERGHEVVLIDLISRGTNNIMNEARTLDGAGLVGIGSSSLSWPTAWNVIRQIRLMKPEIPIVCGGIHATMFDKYLISRFPINYVLRGEAENTLALLCECIETGKPLDVVPNLTWKTEHGIHRNNVDAPIPPGQLGNYALPAYDLLPAGIYKGLAIESSRGCAFDCSFCSTSYRSRWRPMHPSVFVDRLEQLLPYVRLTKHKGTHIVDDEFSTNVGRAVKIVREISSRGLKPSFVYDSRANDMLDEQFVEAMAPYTNQFLIGAECGYDEGLEKIGKKTTCDKLEAAAEMLHRYDISEKASFSFILGLPWEGKREIERTISFAARLFAEYGVTVLLQPYCFIPGSFLWEMERSSLRITEAMYDDFGFFRSLYFFRNMTRLSPAEAWEIEDMIKHVQLVAHVAFPERDKIQHVVPYALAVHYPKSVLEHGDGHDGALGSLRELARLRSEDDSELSK